MSRERYMFRSGSHITGVDPQAAGEALERLRKRHNGRLAPADVVEEARNLDSPIHSAFEWDDTIAAAAYRIDQAGHLIRCIAVDISRSNLETNTVRAFVSVTRDNDRSYTSTVHAMSDRDLRKQVIEKAYAELEAWRARYAELSELARLFEAIDQARDAA